MNCTVCFLKPKHLSGGGPWLSVCRNVILGCPLPLARTGHNALTVYFCTTCTERNISCKRLTEKAPTCYNLQCSEGSFYICWQSVARNKLCQAPDNSLVQWHLHATWLFMFYFSLLSPARPVIGQYLSILASDWFSWVSEDDSRKEWGESRVQKHVCLARTDQWEARTETFWPMRGLVTFVYTTDSCEGVRHLMWRVGSPAPGH